MCRRWKSVSIWLCVNSPAWWLSVCLRSHPGSQSTHSSGIQWEFLSEQQLLQDDRSAAHLLPDDARFSEYSGLATALSCFLLAIHLFRLKRKEKILHICSCISPECRQKTVELVLLFDGSLSMTPYFDRSKDIMVDIMNSFSNTSVRVSALLQYQRIYKTYIYCMYDK